MKRFLIVIPVLLFILLNACTNPTGVPPEYGTAVGQTQTAAVVTPTNSSTPMYINESSLISWKLNTEIEAAEVASKFDQLEHSLGATYQVTDVIFNPDDSTASSLQLFVSCTCALDNDCCTINQAFVITMAAMYMHQTEIEAQVPDTVNKLVVRCLHDNKSVGSITVSWYVVESFLRDPMNGYQIKSDVTYEP